MRGKLAGEPTEHWYRAVWRWHFYAGLLCVPAVLWLSVTGAIYLFKPQIEAALYAPYRNVVSGTDPRLAPDAIAARAEAAVPGSMLHKYVLPESPPDAVQVLVGKGSQDVRVWVHPQTGAVLYQVPEESRFERVVFHLHGELLAGNLGSALVETAACWTLVMLLTGLFLWWPRGAARLAGTLYPRLRRGFFWRDIHAVTGLWITLGAAFLIATGLPWANAWGNWLGEVRALTGTSAGVPDWSTGSSADAARRARDDAAMRAMMGAHAEHRGMTMMHIAPPPAALDAVVAKAETLRFAAPVEVSPPTATNGPWQVRSQAEDRPLRDSAEVTGDGSLIGIERFSQHHWIDRAVGYGVAIHEGEWAGLPNQLINLAVLIGLVTLSASSVVLWWRRRPNGVLGSPKSFAPLRHAWALVGLVLMIALVLPAFGLSLALAVAAEWSLKRLTPRLGHWMGWRASRSGLFPGTNA